MGKYQWFVIFNLCFACFPGWMNFGILIVCPKLNFTCMDYDLNISGQCEYDVVTRYVDNQTEMIDSYTLINDSNMMPCTNFSYDHSQFEYTITERFQLICDREWLITIAKSAYLAGYLIGSTIAGIIGDQFGRKLTLLGGCICGIVTNVASALVPSFWWYVVLRCFIAISEIFVWLSAFILALEGTHKSQRSIPKFVDNCVLPISLLLLGATSFVLNNYQNFHYLIAAFYGVSFLVTLIIIHESPRWLNTQNRQEEARDTVQKIARTNNTEPESLSYLMHECEKQEKGHFGDLFRTPLIRKRTFILFVIWSVFILSYYAIIYNLQDFSDDVRMSLMIMGAIETFSAFPAIVMMRKLGRTMTTFILFLGIAVCCLTMAPLIQYSSTTIMTALALGGKLMANGIFLVAFPYTSELYPTPIRVTGLGACSTVSRVAAMISPQIALLNKLWPPSMVTILGILSILAALTIPLLPDMTYVELPQTIDDGEKLFPNHKYSLKKASTNSGRHAGLEISKIPEAENMTNTA